MSMKDGRPVTCSLTLEFRSDAEAENVHRSVELDNEGFVDSAVHGSAVLARIEADSLKSLLHTLDDFLACISVADRIVSTKD